MSDRFYITTPIYYPNGEPHLGSVYTTTICDVLAQYHRLQGQEVFFLTGTDEHGIKMAEGRQTQGIEPLDLATQYATLFRQVWDELQITYTDFIRTTEPRHKQAVQQIVSKLVEKRRYLPGRVSGLVRRRAGRIRHRNRSQEQRIQIQDQRQAADALFRADVFLSPEQVRAADPGAHRAASGFHRARRVGETK